MRGTDIHKQRIHCIGSCGARPHNLSFIMTYYHLICEIFFRPWQLCRTWIESSHLQCIGHSSSPTNGLRIMFLDCTSCSNEFPLVMEQLLSRIGSNIFSYFYNSSLLYYIKFAGQSCPLNWHNLLGKEAIFL